MTARGGTTPAVSCVLVVDVSDLAERWAPDPAEHVRRSWDTAADLRRRLAGLEAAPSGALVRLRVGAAHPPYDLDGLDLGHLRFEIEAQPHRLDVATEWANALRRVTA